MMEWIYKLIITNNSICNFALVSISFLFFRADVRSSHYRSLFLTDVPSSQYKVMTALRNLVITLIHRGGDFQIVATRRHFSYHPDEAFALLLPRKVA
jgi:hypothetical protein